MSQYIMGKNCLFEVLRATPERIIEVHTTHRPGDELYDQLKKAGIRIKEIGKKGLTNLVDSESHQGYVAKVRPREFVEVHNFLQEDHKLVLMLDSIFDPHNLGAILRAAECFGVDLVVYSKNRGTDITPVVSKTSVGASELVPMARVSNLAETVKQFQKADYWAVAAELSERSQPLSGFEWPEKTLLIMGSEGKGVQQILSRKADFHLEIPMHGQIDSLNVSQATAVLLASKVLNSI
ncbi:MAG: 23S rRNA (guanosine(2251)-2'-O)-methyltransferase RlmB [Simkaniaceae bacterium]|nr:23S rRNA (guanosine(2251)-2'-O)-methyltransferase RlmB [Simkaniaceae bacterium]